MHDIVDTPMGPTTLGPALHLQAMAAAMNHEFLRPTPAKSRPRTGSRGGAGGVVVGRLFASAVALPWYAGV